MQKHKNDLISKLEGKTSAMAETLRKLDDKYVTYVIFCQVFLKMICSQFKGWNQRNHQPVLKFPHFFPASLQAKTAEISKLVDDEAGSIL